MKSAECSQPELRCILFKLFELDPETARQVHTAASGRNPIQTKPFYRRKQREQSKTDEHPLLPLRPPVKSPGLEIVARMDDPEGYLHSRIPSHRAHSFPMTKLCIFVGTLLGSYGGWWAGEAVGFEFLGAFLLSGLGSILGVYAGWKLARNIEGR